MNYITVRETLGTLIDVSHRKTKNRFEPLILFGLDVTKKSSLKPFKIILKNTLLMRTLEKITLKVTAGFTF
jgi:hypothetical protein